MYRLQMNMAAACVAAVIGGMLSGCALVAQNKAMSDSPDAAAAVKDIESGSSLKEIATKAPREDARIAAASKMEDEWPICCIVMDKEQTRGVRLAAFGRLVKLGKAEALLKKRSDLAETIVSAQTASEEKQEPESVEDLFGSRRASKGKNLGQNKKWTFPDEWRIKAIETEHCDRHLKSILLDATEPVSVRIAAAQQLGDHSFDDSEIRQLVSGAATDDGKKKVVQVLIAKSRWIDDNLRDFLLRDKNLSLEDCKYVFSLLSKDAAKLSKTLEYIVYRAQDAEKNSDAERFAMWAIANVGNSETLFNLVEGKGTEKKAARYLVEAVKHMDDAFLEKLLVDKYLKGYNFRRVPEVPYAAVSQLKDPARKETIFNQVAAKAAPVPAERARALAKVCASSPKDAYEIVWRWFFDADETGEKGDVNMRELTDRQALAALLKQAMADRRNLARTEIVPSIKRAVFAHARKQFEALPKEKVDALAVSLQKRAEKLNGEGKTLVVGNYYVGMPLLGLLALEKTQNVKARAKDWCFDGEGKTVIATGIVFDSKNVFRATGIEKNECVIKLPFKLGISAFRVKQTDIKRNRSLDNQIAEAWFGDYSNSFVGGDVYFESENQNKEARVTFWNESGALVLEAL